MSNYSITRGNTRGADDDPTAAAWREHNAQREAGEQAFADVLRQVRAREAAEQSQRAATPEARALANERDSYAGEAFMAEARAHQALKDGDGFERTAGIRDALRAKAGQLLAITFE